MHVGNSTRYLAYIVLQQHITPRLTVAIQKLDFNLAEHTMTVRLSMSLQRLKESNTDIKGLISMITESHDVL